MKKICVVIFILMLTPTAFSSGQVSEFYLAKPQLFLDSPGVLQRFTASDLDETLLEATIFQWINHERAQHKMSLFKYHPKLNKIARAHSKEMATLNYFSHQSPLPDNATLMVRFRKSRTHWIGQIAENIAVSFTKCWIRTGYFPSEIESYPYDTYYKFAKNIVGKWMDSKGHRKNILNPDLKVMAIGIARGTLNGQDAIYVTQNLATKILN